MKQTKQQQKIFGILLWTPVCILLVIAIIGPYTLISSLPLKIVIGVAKVLLFSAYVGFFLTKKAWRNIHFATSAVALAICLSYIAICLTGMFSTGKCETETASVKSYWHWKRVSKMAIDYRGVRNCIHISSKKYHELSDQNAHSHQLSVMLTTTPVTRHFHHIKTYKIIMKTSLPADSTGIDCEKPL